MLKPIPRFESFVKKLGVKSERDSTGVEFYRWGGARFIRSQRSHSIYIFGFNNYPHKARLIGIPKSYAAFLALLMEFS